jgi:hypothetical protein
MRFLAHIILFCAFVNIRAQSRAVELQFEMKSQDCSGVGIDPTGGSSQHKKKYFSNQTIYVYTKGKCVDSLVTDSIGKVSKRMKTGNYELFLPYKHKRTAPIKTQKEFDMECLKKEWLQPDGTLKVSKKGVVFVNKGIGVKKCDWNHNCLKERHIPAGSQG